MNSYQITLFLENDTIYKISKVSAELLEKINELGEPILMPDNISAPREANIPLIIFNKNPNVQLMMSFQTIVISIVENNEINLLGKLADFMSTLNNNDIHSNRFGYVKKSILNNEKIIEFKENTFKRKENIECKDFEFSCLNEITINNINVNCWERYYTNSEINNNLNIIFDVNTKAMVKYDIDIEFIKRFIKESDLYIDKKIFK